MYQEDGEYVKSLQEYAELFLRRYKLFLTPIIIGFIISVFLAVFQPSIYESTAVILIEEPEVPPDIIQSTVTSYADQRLQVIKRRITTTQKVREIVERHNLYPEYRELGPFSDVLERFREDIGMETISARVGDPRSGRSGTATIAFELSYESRYPQAAQQVTDELVTFYLSENIRERQGQVTETTRFLAQEADRLAADIQKLEARLAVFKADNVGKLPDQLELNLRIIDRIERDILEIERRIQTSENQSNFLRAELSTVKPQLDSAVDDEGELSPEQRLRALRREYARLQSSYTEEHPDVVHTRREIETLTRQTSTPYNAPDIMEQLRNARSQLAEALDRYSPEHPEVKNAQRLVEQLTTDLALARSNPPQRNNGNGATNPAYVQLHAQLNAANSERKSLLAQRGSLRTKLEEYETRVLAIPESEREYRALVRDYENAQLKYNETKDKQLAAELSQSLEEGRKSERFTLIEPPQLPVVPIKPRRLLIVALGLVLSMGLGVVVVLLADFVDDGIYGPRQLAVIAGQPPMVMIPRIVTSADHIWSFAKTVVWLSGVGASAGLALAIAHLYIAPLNDLWISMLGRLGV